MSLVTEVLDRSTPPRPSELSKVAFPKYEVLMLSCGAPVYLVENHNQPLVSISLYITAGSASDVSGKEGIASIAMEMLSKGTASRTAPEIAEQIDFLGASLGSSAGWDASTVSTSSLTRFLPTAIDLLADITLNPVFAQEELERARVQRLAGIKHAKSDPGYLADTMFAKHVYGDHAYALESGGTENSLALVTRDQLKEYHTKYFHPKNAYFIVAGDVSSSDITSMLGEKFAAWEGLSTPTPSTINNLTAKPGVSLVQKPQAVQSALRVGHIAIPRMHEDYIKCYVLNMLLGGYFNSRINANLRERNGFTYGARSFFDARKQTGAFAVSTEVRTEVTAKATEEILNEIKKIRSEAVSDDELSMVKNYIIGSFPLSIETPQQVAGRLALIPMYGAPSNYYDTFRAEIAAVTKDDLLEMAETHLHPEAVTIVASGNAEVLKNEMGMFGDVQVFDQNFTIVS